MKNDQQNNRNDELPPSTRSQRSTIEARWAPPDPRDRLSDQSATQKEKLASTLRIFASFHPVLNVGVLFVDSFRKLGVLRAGFIWFVISAAMFALISFLLSN